MKIIADNGAVYSEDRYHDPFFKLFLSDKCLRESCYCCSSKGYKRRADITLGDFWGADKVAPEIEDGKSLSLVLIHTSKGKALFDAVAGCKCAGKAVDFSNAIDENKAFLQSPMRPTNRDDLYEDILYLNLDKLVWKYTLSFKGKIRVLLENFHILRRRNIYKE